MLVLKEKKRLDDVVFIKLQSSGGCLVDASLNLNFDNLTSQ